MKWRKFGGMLLIALGWEHERSRAGENELQPFRKASGAQF
jgi:hypothetical protein